MLGLNAVVFHIGFSVQPLFMARLAMYKNSIASDLRVYAS